MLIELTYDILDPVATRVAPSTFLVDTGAMNAADGNLDAFAGVSER